MTLDGITSACEENTRHSRYAKPYPRNYPRARGEYNQVVGCLIYCWELPPRTRRIQPKVLDWPYEMGTTSAYAENTRMWGCLKKKSRNYLRVRGEYEHHMAFARGGVELPPRTRRIPPMPWQEWAADGTTSAYAENTAQKAAAGLSVAELPPRTRRIQLEAVEGRVGVGTTSAYAENT